MPDDPTHDLVLPSARLRVIATCLTEARTDAWSVPLGGSWWPTLPLSIADHLIVALRECAAQVAQLEALADELAEAQTDELAMRSPPPPPSCPSPPSRPPLRIVWSRE